ncbi:MAG TPA: class I SAM-dependent methyltransferase [Candidatus Lokiarchaeia archaeon]|nr:class I SAM-dependent methyltransferase [Candidatus Lokiarchaeia archaeon]
MLSKLKAWIPFMKLGNNRKKRDELLGYFRYLVFKQLYETNVFKEFKEPVPLKSVCEHLGWEYPSKYVDDLITALVNDGVLLKSGNNYSLSPQLMLTLQEPKVENFEDFNTAYAEFVKCIPDRLQGKSCSFTGQISLFNWDSALASKMYQANRDSAFNWANLKDISGRTLLDVGCGPGYETADIWTRIGKKNVAITAIEPDEGLIKIAKDEFVHNIKKFGYVSATDDADVPNIPRFSQGSVMSLEFEDNSFDMVYFSNILHWTPDPSTGIKEMVRIMKPGGIIFGTQVTLEAGNPYMDLVTRTIKETHGFFWKKDFIRWCKEAGLKNFKTCTIMNTFRGIKP